MTGLAVRWLTGLHVIVLMLAGAYWAGDHNRNNAWLAKQAKVERYAHDKYVREVERGDAAVKASVAEYQAMQNNFQNLTEKFNGLSKRVPLVFAGRGGACRTGADPLGAAPLGQPPLRPETLDGGELAGGGGDLLTRGAVWMWNSALTGTDQPSGACGLLDTTEAACAAATTLDLDDAWANHKTNAQLCAEDRLAHQRLIDFLTMKPTK